MIRLSCLRLARRSTTSPLVVRCSPLARAQLPIAQAAWLHDKPSRWADAPKEEESSPFKKQRQEDLREDQKSSTPLYAEAYPRLGSDASRKAIPDFVEECQDSLPAEQVSLAGRVRSKRVVGKSLIFVDIVNEFQKAQVMINKKKCQLDGETNKNQFTLFKNLIQVGDHICTLPPSPPHLGSLS